MVVETIALIIGDNDGALRPVRAGSNGVYLISEEGFRNLGVRVGGVIIVTLEVGARGNIWILRNQTVKISVSATKIKDAAGLR